MLILSTLAVGTACVAVLFDTAAFGSLVAFGGAPAPGNAPALGTDPVGVEVAFDEATPDLFEVVGAFGAIAFQLDTFARFPAGPAPASFLLFFIASLLTLEPGSKQGP
jgi:hypothetical protein